MADLTNIKEKMNLFLDEFKNLDTPDEAIEKFKQIFDGEYYETFTDVDEPYYECHTQKLYLDNGYGIGIEKSWGPFDFTGGGVVSHEGEDLYIFSKLGNEGIILFEFSEKKKIPTNTDSLYDIDLSTKNILSIDDDLIFNFIPENDLQFTDEMFIARYENLKRKAELNHDNDVENDLISYYGGLDVTINSTEYYLYNALLKSKYNEDFMNKAIPLFIQDFPSYFKDEIEECNQALYIIENKDKYYKLAEYEEVDFHAVESEYNYKNSIDKLEKQKEKLQIKLDDALSEINDIKNKRYNLIDFFKGIKKKDLEEINRIQHQKNAIETQLYLKVKELEEYKSNFEQFKKVIDENDKKINELKEQLKYPLKDFSLISEFEDAPYIKGEYHVKVILDRLINKKKYYTNKLQEIEFMKSYANSKELTIENEKEELYEKTI